MGGGASNKFYPTEDIPGHDVKAIKFYREVLELSDSELQRLYDIFCEADFDKSGYLREDELRQFLRIEQSDLYDFLFKMYRKGSRGYINFFEFVCSVSVARFFCTNKK
jgi:Ca2+-binding EF-hand superfamily protein